MTSLLEAIKRPGVRAAIATITVIAVSSTITFPLLTLLMEREGESRWSIGSNTALASFGILLAGPIWNRLLARIGAPNIMFVCLSLMTLCLVGFMLGYNYVIWCFLRFGLGIATGGLYIASEYWILSLAPWHLRGRVIPFYGFVLAAGFAFGPATLRVIGYDGPVALLVATTLAILAFFPVYQARFDAPLIDTPSATPLIDTPSATPTWRYVYTDPSLICAVVLYGAIQFGAMGLVPVWAVDLGHGRDAGVMFAVVISIGTLLSLPFIGWAADRFDARTLLLGAAGMSVGVAFTLPLVGDNIQAAWAALFIWGGTAIGLYIASLVEMGARYKGADLVGGNAAIIAAYGVGATFGPQLIGFSMDVWGPLGLPFSFGVLSCAFIGLVVVRAAKHPGAAPRRANLIEARRESLRRRGLHWRRDHGLSNPKKAVIDWRSQLRHVLVRDPARRRRIEDGESWWQARGLSVPSRQPSHPPSQSPSHPPSRSHIRRNASEHGDDARSGRLTQPARFSYSTPRYARQEVDQGVYPASRFSLLPGFFKQVWHRTATRVGPNAAGNAQSDNRFEE